MPTVHICRYPSLEGSRQNVLHNAQRYVPVQSNTVRIWACSCNTLARAGHPIERSPLAEIPSLLGGRHFVFPERRETR